MKSGRGSANSNHRHFLATALALLILGTLIAPAGAQDCDDPRLIAWYEFENGGTEDSCGEHHGENWGAWADTTDYGPQDPEGEFMTSLWFDGEEAHVRALDLGGLPAFTFSIWVNYIPVDREVALFSGENGGWDRGLHVTENGQLDIHLGAGEGREHFVVPFYRLPEEEWTHLVLQYLPDDVRLSINGRFGWSSGAPAGPSDDTLWDIGSAPEGEHLLYNFRGRVDELVIYELPLPPEEIRVIFESGLSHYGAVPVEAPSFGAVKSIYR